MTAVKEGNRTLVADGVDQCVSHIDCLCEWHVMNFYLVMLNCHHRIVVCEICHQVDPYSLSPVEIHFSTCSVKHR